MSVEPSLSAFEAGRGGVKFVTRFAAQDVSMSLVTVSATVNSERSP